MSKKSTGSKVFSAVSFTILGVLLIIVAYLIFSKVTGRIPTFFGNSYARIVSASMEDTIPTGSYIKIKSIDTDDIAVGDIITFYSTDESIAGEPNTHRVVAISEAEDGSRIFTTKGDNNPVNDAYPVMESAVIGKYVKTMPVITSVGNFFSNKAIFFLLILIPALAMFTLEINSFVKKAREVKKEQLIAQEVERLRKQDEESNNDEGESKE